jgi:hypothetical protein
MSDLSAFLNEQMNNPEFAQEYNAVQPEMDAIRSMIKHENLKISRKNN